MTDTPSSSALRGAVLGLGMIGRHHARLLQAMPDVRFAGAVDPGGDRFGAAPPGSLFASVDELLASGAPDFAIVAVPTEEHLNAVRALAGAGVHVLVEKPLASSVDAAHELIDIVEVAGVHAAVGHVERFNPALVALRDRLDELGDVFLVRTERVGPFPDRVRDVGVVMDLATHDLDLVRWLGGAPVARVAAQTKHQIRRDHEDVVLVTGALDNGVAFNCIVDWVSPTKVRRTRVLGELGMLEADTLTADLTLYRNGQVTSEWDAAQALKGVSEGDATRFALERREPLLIELEAFCALLRGDADAPVVTLAEGLETVQVADAVLRSARAGETVLLRVKAVVVALGKVGLPLAAAIAQAGHDVVGADIDPRVVEAVNAGRAPFPNEAGLEAVLAETPVRAVGDTTAAVADAPDLVIAVPPLFVDDAGAPQWDALDAVADVDRGRTEARHDGRARDDGPGRHDTRPLRPGARAQRAACAQVRTSTSRSRRSACRAAACSATSRPTRSSSAGCRRSPRRAPPSCTATSSPPRSVSSVAPRRRS